jgi:hypothetical protein
MNSIRKLYEKPKCEPTRGRRRIRVENTRSSIGSSTGIPTNHATKAWRPAGTHASSRNTKPRVGGGHTKGNSSREKFDLS